MLHVFNATSEGGTEWGQGGFGEGLAATLATAGLAMAVPRAARQLRTGLPVKNNSQPQRNIVFNWC